MRKVLGLLGSCHACQVIPTEFLDGRCTKAMSRDAVTDVKNHQRVGIVRALDRWVRHIKLTLEMFIVIGLGVVDFMKRTTMVACNIEAFNAIAPAGIVLANAEGLGAHALSMQIRMN